MLVAVRLWMHWYPTSSTTYHISAASKLQASHVLHSTSLQEAMEPEFVVDLPPRPLLLSSTSRFSSNFQNAKCNDRQKAQVGEDTTHPLHGATGNGTKKPVAKCDIDKMAMENGNTKNDL